MSKTIKLLDSHGAEVLLAEELGKGGEGSVYTIEGQDDLVAKLYHQRPLPADVLGKLKAMVAQRTPELDAIAAWPQALLLEPRSREVLGFLMPKVSGSHHLHELYGTANRRRHFPDVRWHHLLLAARNVAAAFESVHAAGIVIGDVNQGNMLVNNSMCVRLIDCDSFQIDSNGELFSCPVGTPHFTPPELQSQKLRDVRRTVDHDAFGLAVIVFHLLFVGRHPFAGRFKEIEEVPLERAIAERRFAFSQVAAASAVEPPPASLLLSDLPRSLADLFERAFRGGLEPGDRPAVREWVEQLETLMKQRRVCSCDQTHIFFNQLRSCPWCRIEDEGGPAFFFGEGGVSRISTNRLEEMDQRIQKLGIPVYPDLAEARLAVPKALKPKHTAVRPPLNRCDVAALGLTAAAVLCLLGIKWLAALGVGALGTLAAGAYLIACPQCRHRRSQGGELLQNLAELQQRLVKGGHVIVSKHRRRRQDYERAVADLKSAYETYQTPQDKLEDVLALQRTSQLHRFLAGHLLEDNRTKIAGLTASMLAILESYGVESALDIDSLKLVAVPLLTPTLTMELLAWRENVEGRFKFNPEHGISFDDAKSAGEWALSRFKLVQARKVLMGARQLDALVDAGSIELKWDLKKFDTLADQARGVANQLREFQSGRRPLERELNRHPFLTAGIACGIPVVGLLLRALFA